LRSKANKKFIAANPDEEKQLEVNRDEFKEWEHFRMIELLDRHVLDCMLGN
jgi:NOL1/NOP2/fmu family ribosome biogenesis protein